MSDSVFELSTDTPPRADRIGSVALPNPTVLAPLAGITNLPFRLIAKQHGCGLVYSEMVSANGLAHASAKTLSLMATAPEDRPLAIQIFGSDPVLMAEAATIVANQGADMVDLNFGCSVKKILKSGSGSALMKTPDLARKIMRAVRRAVDIPLTIKIRSGWTPDGEQALRVGQMAQDCGVNAIALHPRTATQGFGGQADWSLIGRLKSLLQIPVIGNGDITDAQRGIDMLNQTGCDAVMIGRATIANPWIFGQLTALLKNSPLPQPDLADRLALMRAYLEASIQYLGEELACRLMRSRWGWFVKGLPHNSHFRNQIRFLASRAEALSHLNQYADLLVERTGFEDTLN